jgi:DNA-binding PadR family transcriptional regulator
MLELAILGLLKEGSVHGYELRKQLGQRLGFFWKVSFGSLYPTLRKLERRGAVEKMSPQARTSRRKQVYRITSAGEQEFFELLSGGADSRWEEEKFPLRVAFFRYLRPELRIRLLERRKTYLEDKLAEGHRSLKRAKRGSGDTYTVSLVRHGMDTTESDIAWIDELITAERAALAERGDEPDEPPVDEPEAGTAGLADDKRHDDEESDDGEPAGSRA